MARPRNEFHTILEAITPNVYFDPPDNLQMSYPCIRYIRDDIDTEFAGDKPYSLTKRYQITVIDRDVDSPLPDVVAHLPMCRHDRHYKAMDLIHDIFNIFF